MLTMQMIPQASESCGMQCLQIERDTLVDAGIVFVLQVLYIEIIVRVVET